MSNECGVRKTLLQPTREWSVVLTRRRRVHGEMNVVNSSIAHQLLKLTEVFNLTIQSDTKVISAGLIEFPH
jgi:hypothetical protein